MALITNKKNNQNLNEVGVAHFKRSKIRSARFTCTWHWYVVCYPYISSDFFWRDFHKNLIRNHIPFKWVNPSRCPSTVAVVQSATLLASLLGTFNCSGYSNKSLVKISPFFSFLFLDSLLTNFSLAFLQLL